MAGTPDRAAARAEASSPSGWRIDCTPIGAVSTGAAIVVPSTVRPSSRSETSLSMCGTIRWRANAARFSRIVSSVPDPPNR